MAMLTGGGAGTVIAGGVRRPFSGRLDSAGRLVGHLRWCHVVREIWCSTTVSNCSRNRVPAAAIPEANPGVVVAETEGSGLGVVPGARTELQRWLAVAGVWRSGVPMAARILCTAELGRGSGIRGGGCCVASWLAGGDHGTLKEGSGDLGRPCRALA